MKLAITLLALAGTLHAELKWDAINKRITYQPGTKEARVEFAYTNNGTAPIRIMDVKGGCNCCTSASATKLRVKPGEGGIIKMRIDFSGKEIPLVKAVAVITDDDKTTPLIVHVTTADGKSVKIPKWGKPRQPKP